MTRGFIPTLVFAPSFFFFTIVASASELTADISAGVFSRGVGAFEMADSVSSSSSAPNDNLPLAAVLRFFLNTGFGVDALCLAN